MDKQTKGPTKKKHCTVLLAQQLNQWHVLNFTLIQNAIYFVLFIHLHIRSTDIIFWTLFKSRCNHFIIVAIKILHYFALVHLFHIKSKLNFYFGRPSVVITSGIFLSLFHLIIISMGNFSCGFCWFVCNMYTFVCFSYTLFCHIAVHFKSKAFVLFSHSAISSVHSDAGRFFSLILHIQSFNCFKTSGSRKRAVSQTANIELSEEK